MKVAVCIKRVPDMEMRFSLAADKKSLDPAGLKYEMGDFDGYALEVGLQLVEKQGGEVVVISVGPDGSQETLRKALAMGAARAVQLKAEQVQTFAEVRDSDGAHLGSLGCTVEPAPGA